MTEKWTLTPDQFQGDLAIGTICADVPPTRGLAGWTDWLLDNPIASALTSGRVKATAGEKLLIAGRPPMGVSKLLFIGCNHSAATGEELESLVQSFADAIQALRGQRILVEIPADNPDTFLRLLTERTSMPRSVELFAYIPEVPCRI